MQSSLRGLIRPRSKNGTLSQRLRRSSRMPTACLVRNVSQLAQLAEVQAAQAKQPPARSGFKHRNAQISALVTAIEQDLPVEENTPFVPPPNPFHSLHSLTQGCLKTDQVSHNGQFTFSGRVDIPGVPPITTSASDTSLSKAKDAMALEMLALLHARRFLPDEAELEQNKTIKQNDASATADVYNYCARLVQWPEITYSKSRVLPLRRGQLQRQAKCTIRFAEHDIEVSAVAVGSQAQFIAQDIAAVRFKDAVEKHVAEQGESLIVNDAGGLNLANAKKFHDWLNLEDASYKSHVLVMEADAGHVATAFLNSRRIGSAVEARARAHAYDRAKLIGAIYMCQRHPELLAKFRDAIVAGRGEIFQRISPVDIGVSEDSILTMQETLVKARNSGFGDEHAELSAAEPVEEFDRDSRSRLSDDVKHKVSRELKDKYTRYLANPQYENARKQRAELPMIKYEKEVIDLIDKNVYSIIVGATGSGKTTQVPQIILQKAWAEGRGGHVEVMCTQPRRIAATSVSKRMKGELGSELADKIGYAVRHEANMASPGGSVTYCTTGVLLARLQKSPELLFDTYSHLIIDEVHERDKIIDFTLTTLKSAIESRQARGLPVPRVTLMSATLDSELFSNYFQNTSPDRQTLTPAPILEVPGKLFPVKQRYLNDIMNDLETSYSIDKLVHLRKDTASVDYLKTERMWERAVVTDSSSSQPPQDASDEPVVDWKGTVRIPGNENDTTQESICPYGLIATSVAHIARTTKDGSILVFLPGLEELEQVKAIMDENILGVNFNDETKYKTYLLHSSITETQSTVFEDLPKGIRKVILSTNIGETSITIPDVKHVIDSGKARELRYDFRSRISRLMCSWISKSNARQRLGRAGRVSEGNYYAMFTKERYESLRQVAVPEILRTDLQVTCLNVANSFGRNQSIAEFLAAAIEPPSQAAVDEAVANLIDMNALTESEKVTALGQLLAILPIHPSLGKMIVLGVLFRCLDPIIVACSGVDERTIFNLNPDVKTQALQRKVEYSAGTKSDHLAAYKAFNEIRKVEHSQGPQAAWQYAQDNFLSYGSYRAIHRAANQIQTLLLEAGLIEKMPRFMRDDMTFGGMELNVNSGKPHLFKAILLAGLAPNLAYKYPGQTPHWRASSATRVLLPSMTVFSRARTKENVASDPANSQTTPLATYGALIRSNDGNILFMRDVTMVSPLMAALFSRRLDLSEKTPNLLTVDDWLPLSIHADYPHAAQTVHEFKLAMERMQIGAFADLARKGAFTGDDTRDYLVEKIVAILDNEVDYFDRDMYRTWLHSRPGSEEAHREAAEAEESELQEMEYAKDFYADKPRPDLVRWIGAEDPNKWNVPGYNRPRIKFARSTGKLNKMLPIARDEKQQTLRQIHDIALLMNRNYRSVNQERRELEVDATAFQSPRYREHLGKVGQEIEFSRKQREEEARLNEENERDDL